MDVAQKMFREAKGVTLIGQQARTTADLAALLQVTRNPFYETFRVLFIKDGTVVGHTVTSSRMTGVTAAFASHGDQIEVLARHVRERAKELGADGFYINHNHPTGDVTPSKQYGDLDFQSKLHEMLDGLHQPDDPPLEFHGQIITNHHRFTFIERAKPEHSGKKGLWYGQGNKVPVAYEEYTLPGHETPDPFRPEGGAVPFVGLGAHINDSYALARVAQTIDPSPENVTAAWLDSHHRVIEIGMLSQRWLHENMQTNGKMLDMRDLLAEYAYSTGGAHVILLMENTPANREVAERLVTSGIILDVAFSSRNNRQRVTEFHPAPGHWSSTWSAQRTAAGLTPFGQDKSHVAHERATTRTFEPTTPYDRESVSSTHGVDTRPLEDQTAENRTADAGRAGELPAVRAYGGGSSPGGGGGRLGLGGRAVPVPEGRARTLIRERDLFGNESESEPQQGSLFSSQEGTAASRNLEQTELAARSELAKLRQQEQGASPVQRVKIAARIAELEKLLNRDKAITPDEMATRARAETQPPKRRPVSELDDLIAAQTARVRAAAEGEERTAEVKKLRALQAERANAVSGAYFGVPVHGEELGRQRSRCSAVWKWLPRQRRIGGPVSAPCQ